VAAQGEGRGPPVIAEFVFWSALVLFFHPWVGYPLVLKVLTWAKRQRVSPDVQTSLPSVSVVVPVHNGGGRITEKLRNILGQDYPSSTMEVIVVSDGSTDDTVQRARSVEAENVFVHETVRNQGKSAAQNFGVTRARNEIIIFTDVDSDLDRDFLRNILPHFTDPRVACVGGKALLKGQDGNISNSQGIYWRLEQFIRGAESSLGMLHSLPGWGFAIRRSDFVPLDQDTGDDMILPMEMALRGRRSVFAPEAVVSDYMPSTLKGEYAARQRITLRNFVGLMRRRALLVPWRFPRMSFAICSHKLLRWMSPLFMLLMLGSGCWLCLHGGGPVYRLLFLGQVAGYLLGLAGLAGMRIPVAGHVSSFLVANTGFLLGILRFASGRRIKSYKNVV
jgi:cellulose synthase/poly-beta-1,6-N-acetylglucosamine synthase-like glycosyltransferase